MSFLNAAEIFRMMRPGMCVLGSGESRGRGQYWNCLGRNSETVAGECLARQHGKGGAAGFF